MSSKPTLRLLILLMVFSKFSVSQSNYIKDYYPYINIADSLYGEQKYDSALLYYKKAFNNHIPFNRDVLTATICAYHTNDTSAYEYLLKSFQLGIPLDLIKKSNRCKIIRKNISNWKTTKAQYNSIREIYLKSLNLDLRNQLKKIDKSDQKYRKRIFVSRKQWRKQTHIDSVNYNKILEIITQYGYPSEKIIGGHIDNSDAEITAYMVFMHNPRKELIEYLLPFVKNGQMSPYRYARIVDRIYYIQHKQQFYGTMYNKHYDFPIWDAQNLNKRRREIGLYSIEMQAKILELCYKQ